MATCFIFSFRLWGVVVLLFCSPWEEWVFELFCLKSSNCFPVKTRFFKRPFFFVRSVCNHGALKLHLHVVALPASLARSWPAEITKKLSRSGLDFLVLVLESCNSFIMNAFFNFASVNFFQATWFRFSFCRQGLVVPLFCSPCDDWISRFFQFENFKLFSVKLNFSEGPSFFVPFVCNHGAFNLRLHV